jgi:hypothetical protein
LEDLLAAAELPSQQGYLVDRAVVRPGWQFAAARLRADSLTANPVGATTPFPLMVAGLPLFTNPPAFDSSKAVSFVIDSSCCLIGIRQDLTITQHTDGVIVQDGLVVFSAMQQDSIIFRCVMRVGYLLVAPPTGSGLHAGQRAPVAAVVPAGGGGNGEAGQQSAAAPAATSAQTHQTQRSRRPNT